MRVFVDTNMVISALLFSNGKTAKVFSHLLRKHTVIISSYTREECKEVFEKKSILNDISSIRSAMKEKDTSKMQMLLTNIKNICSKVAENLIASGIVQQISNLLP